MRKARIYLLGVLMLGGCATSPPTDTLRISIVGTNDVHGVLVSEVGRGGLTTLSGYVNALREARADDGGAVLLIDAGDMWQGTLESNLNEGTAVVDAFNAMRYTAAAIGNHEFDFGPAGALSVPKSASDDPRGNLKARAQQMAFPLLAANLIDEATGELVAWDNVSPSTMLEVQGIRIGIIGTMTERALTTIIASNVKGLAMESLSTAVTREARKLRTDGAQLVIVTTHAGSRCENFDDPHDLSSCNMNGEVMRLANALPQGLVNHIVAGHTHEQIAHFVNGISITSGFARTVSFGRTDFVIDRRTGAIRDQRVFQPQVPCPYVDDQGACAWDEVSGLFPASYEDHLVVPDPAVVEIANAALSVARDRIDEEVGPILANPFTLDGNPESPLGNLFTDALLEVIGGDVVVYNVSGGIRDTLPAGKLTYGSVYGMIPFDNRAVRLEISGYELREIFAAQAHKSSRRAGIAGLQVFVDCSNDIMDIRMLRSDGSDIANDETITLIANDFLALGGDDILSPIIPDHGFQLGDELPLVRDALLDWFKARGFALYADEFRSDEARWNITNDLPESCALPSN